MRPAPASDQRGMVLLIVLLVISLITVMAASLSRTGQTTRQSVSAAQQRLQVKWQLLGAEAAVAADLQHQLDASGGMLPNAAAWLSPRSVRVGGESVSYALSDVGACFNLNWLLAVQKNQTGQKGSQDALPALAWFQQLLARAGVGQNISLQALQDMLQGYQFRDPSQLLAVAALAPAAWQRLRPQLCAVSGPVRGQNLNINGLTVAQIPLIQAALKKPVDDDRLRQLLASRPEKGWKDPGQIPPNLSSGLPVATLFGTSSTDYQLTLESDAPGGRWILRTRLHYEKKKMHVVYRQFEDNAE